eukprot:340758-Hanusia_phi.AAC.1
MEMMMMMMMMMENNDDDDDGDDDGDDDDDGGDGDCNDDDDDDGDGDDGGDDGLTLIDSHLTPRFLCIFPVYLVLSLEWHQPCKPDCLYKQCLHHRTSFQQISGRRSRQ